MNRIVEITLRMEEEDFPLLLSALIRLDAKKYQMKRVMLVAAQQIDEQLTEERRKNEQPS